MMPAVTARDILAIAPQIVVALFGILVLLVDAFWPKTSRRVLANLCVVGLVAAAAVSWAVVPRNPQPALQGMVIADGYTAFFTTVAALAAILGCWLSISYLAPNEGFEGEYFALLMFTTLGAIIMAASVNLICVFLGLEILSISLYILSGFQTERLESDESAMKYFLLGAFASAFLLYGIALVYGATGNLNIREIAQALQGAAAGRALEPGKDFLLLAGLALMLVGFGFKVAVVPFHVWTPDVYEGAPTAVTAFMSVSAKAAGFAAFLRVLGGGIQDPTLQVQVSAVLASIAGLTMLVGNVVAVVQPNIKRMLAYSSIAHAGYILAGLVAAVRPAGFAPGLDVKSTAVSAVLFYMLAYTVANIGAFGVVLALRRRGEEILQISDLAGVGYRHPILAALMTLFLLSLAGLPPTAGFFGKLFLIQALVGMRDATNLIWLIVLFVLTSAVSFYYYLGVVRAMYMDRTGADAGEGTQFVPDWHLRLALGVSALGTILFGLWAGGAFGLAQRVAEGFFGGGPLAMR